MTDYVGFDLGTTNSAICIYDGETLRLLKSPDQNDVTPSAIYVDPRGNRLYGKRAYDNAARNPDSAAILFKRFMGTSTPIKLSAAKLELTPEECSAEILRVLFGYLPEQLRRAGVTGSVITVPAAFNQMQKDATLTGAELAGIGKVALMQEPVAAVMAVMRQRKTDGRFLVFDFGGGTLDVAIAHSIAGRVSLLAHGGIAMCGGRDFDRLLLANVVTPWLLEHFALPEEFVTNPRYKTLLRMGAWAAEKAKIELSARPDTIIALTESELGTRDEKNTEIYLDIPLTRATFDALTEELVAESIQATRETLEKASLTPNDVDRIVFVGGPTQYKPMRDKVAFELGIAASTDVNPMTAVAEGAAVFAESIDWASETRGRKSSRGSLAAGGDLNVTVNFVARTPDTKAKVSLKVANVVGGATFEINSLDTGWSSGRVPLRDGATVDVVLAKAGENSFKIFLFGADGAPVTIAQPRFTISRTAATIDAIPSSSSIGFEVDDARGGRSKLAYVVREGDPLPKKGQIRFHARTAIRARSADALSFRLWEGDIEDQVSSNRAIGELAISGKDFDSNVIAPGAELVCDYEVLDSGNVRFEVSVPSIGASFPSSRGFYSRQLAQFDFLTAAQQVKAEAEGSLRQLRTLTDKVGDDRLRQASAQLEEATRIDGSSAEESKRAMDRVLAARRVLAQVRRDHLPETRQVALDDCVTFFNATVRKHARPAELSEYENLIKTAQAAIDRNATNFEVLLDEMRGRNFNILWRQDYFVVDRFNWLTQSPALYVDKALYAHLVARGKEALAKDEIGKLREIVAALYDARVQVSDGDDTLAPANIVRS
jgi:molecular chaperone DnaK